MRRLVLIALAATAAAAVPSTAAAADGRSAASARANGTGGRGAAPARAATAPAGLVPDVAAARAYVAGRPGTVAFAVRTERRLWGVDADRTFASASVVKAMLLVAYVRDARDRPLRQDERALLSPMIRRSDNRAANTIFTRVGTTGLRRLALAAGMTRFTPRRRSGACRGSPPVTRRGSSSASTGSCRPATARTRCNSCTTSSPASAGASAASRSPTGPSTSRAAGARPRARSTTRSPCSRAATSASPSRSSPPTTAATRPASRRSKASSAGC